MLIAITRGSSRRASSIVINNVATFPEPIAYGAFLERLGMTL